MTRLGIHKKVLVKINNKMIYLILLYLIIPCFHHVNFDCGIKSIPNGRKGQIKISQNQICSNLYEKKFFFFFFSIKSSFPQSTFNLSSDRTAPSRNQIPAQQGKLWKSPSYFLPQIETNATCFIFKIDIALTSSLLRCWISTSSLSF